MHSISKGISYKNLYLFIFVLIAVPLTLPYEDPLTTIPCDFENGLCPGYEVDSKSKVQWYLLQGPTSSQFTGPSHDKTLGQRGNGNYQYHIN